MLIQIILLAIIAMIVSRLFWQFKSKSINWRQFAGWLLIWIMAATVIIWPKLAVRAAEIVGIGRGSDLVVYLALIFLFYSVFRLLLRMEQLEKNITLMVRSEALAEIRNGESEQE